MIELFIKLLMGHALADFALQTDIMAKLKNRHKKPDFIPEGQKYIPCWPYWLSAHGLIHGGAVCLITGNVYLGITETILHCWIDFMKCENWTNPNQDQTLHVLCKIGYLFV
jgi:hypothetical protein